MHPDHEHLFVIRTIEDTDPPTLGKVASRTPEKVMLQFLGARLFEAEDLASLRIDARHHVADSAVLAGTVHPLKNQQQSITVRGVMKLLQGTQPADIFCQKLAILLLRLIEGFDYRRPISEFERFPGTHSKLLRANLHLVPLLT